jgi:hypothetical protein
MEAGPPAGLPANNPTVTPQHANTSLDATPVSPKIITPPERLYRQIQAFIEASEEVEIEQDTIEDLMSVLNACDNAVAQESSEDEESADELDLSALYSVTEEEEG